MANNKPKTIDEFFIQKYEELERENEYLTEQKKALEMTVKHFEEIMHNIKKDFVVELINDNDGKPYIRSNNSYIWSGFQKEKFEYYKVIFSLTKDKEEGENEDEQ